MLLALPPTTSKLLDMSGVCNSLGESAAIGRNQDVELITNACHAEMRCMPCQDIHIMVWACCSTPAQAHQLERAECTTSYLRRNIGTVYAADGDPGCKALDNNEPSNQQYNILCAAVLA